MTAPTTPFEDATADFPAWTSLGEESTFIDALLGQTSRIMSRWMVDTVTDKTPIYVYAVGHPTAPTRQQIRDASNILVVGLQHGREPSGREMSLQRMRDFAFTEHAATTAYLADHPVIFMPSTSPEAFVRAQNNNALNQNTNRGHHSLEYVESRAIQQVITDYRPRIVLDFHERGLDNSIDVMIAGGESHLNVDSEIADLSVNLRDGFFAALTAEGYTSAIWPDATDDRRLRAAALRNILSLLIEPYGVGAFNTDGITHKARVELCKVILDTAIEWHKDNLSAVEDAYAGAASRNVIDGDNQEPLPDPSNLTSWPLGYTLTEAQEAGAWSKHKPTFRHVAHRRDDGSMYIPLGQADRRQLVLMLDARGTYTVTAGTRTYAPPSFASMWRVFDGAWRNDLPLSVSGSRTRVHGITDGGWST